MDEFWTYVGEKKRKVWLIYAYHRNSGEIVAWVWGKRNYKTAKRLLQRLDELKFSYDVISSDDWKSFVKAFKGNGKEHTKGIEGNNCRLQY